MDLAIAVIAANATVESNTLSLDRIIDLISASQYPAPVPEHFVVVRFRGLTQADVGRHPGVLMLTGVDGSTILEWPMALNISHVQGNATSTSITQVPPGAWMMVPGTFVYTLHVDGREQARIPLRIAQSIKGD